MRPLCFHHQTSKLVRLLLCFSFLLAMANPSWGAEEKSESESSETVASDSESVVSENPDGEGTNDDGVEAEPSAARALHYLPNIAKKRAQSLIHHMKLMERLDEVVQLSSLANANDNDAGLAEDYYGLFLADATGDPQGGVLILHDSQQHGHWPDIVAPLREYLPQHGWTTLTIELPDIPARRRIPRQDLSIQPLSASTASPASNTETRDGAEPITTNKAGEPLLTEEAIDNAGPDLQGQPAALENDTPTDDSLEPALPKLAKLPDLASKAPAASSPDEEMTIDLIEHYRKQNKQRIFAAMEYLRSKGQFNLVIIGYGIGAAWAIDYITQQDETTKITATKGDNKGLTLVTIDALPSRHSIMTMNQQLVTLQLPFLDLIQPNKAYALKQGEARRAIMMRNKNELYQQIITSNMASYHEDENPTNRRIRGWLKTNAGGTLVKMNPN